MIAKLEKPYEIVNGKIKPSGTILMVSKQKYKWLLENGYLTQPKRRGKIEKKIDTLKLETKIK